MDNSPYKYADLINTQEGKEMLPVATSTAPAPVPSPKVVLVGPSNTNTQCPFCLASVNTSIKHTATSRTHILALLCCGICCCCIPYCMDSTRNVDHYCPSCRRFLGSYQK